MSPNPFSSTTKKNRKSSLVMQDYVKGIHNNVKLVLQLFSYFMTIAINKMDKCGLSNTACHECLAMKT